MVRRSLISRAVILAALALTATPGNAGEVRVHGATTVTYGLIKPKQSRIEQDAGVKIHLVPSSTTRGLADLAQGQADIAMLAEPLETAAENVNKARPGLVKESELIGSHVGNAYIQFIVHPSNPVSTLSKAQLAGLFSGKIKNWTQLGGADQPVLLIGEPSSSLHRLIAEALAINYAAELRPVQNTNQNAVVVMQVPGALSYISTAHDIPERKRLKIVDSEVKLPLKLYLAHNKRASADVTRVVAAAEKAARE